VAGSAGDNTRNGVAITHQTGQVQTPSASPDGKEIVYLSDSGGHANLRVAKVDGSSPPRQIYFERDPVVVIGVPVWSLAGDKIVFVRNYAGTISEWLVNPDGNGPREFVRQGVAAVWSPHPDPAGEHLARGDQVGLHVRLIAKVSWRSGPPSFGTVLRLKTGGYAIVLPAEDAYTRPEPLGSQAPP
jgi:Tol biopolymer transport system component